MVITVIYSQNVPIASNKNIFNDWSKNMVLNGGRGLNISNTTNGSDCLNGAVGALCVTDPRTNWSQVIIDGKNLPTTNPILIDSSEIPNFNTTKILGGALVSFKSSLVQNLILIINSMEIRNATFTDAFLKVTDMNQINYVIVYSLALKENA